MQACILIHAMVEMERWGFDLRVVFNFYVSPKTLARKHGVAETSGATARVFYDPNYPFASVLRLLPGVLFFHHHREMMFWVKLLDTTSSKQRRFMCNPQNRLRINY